LYSAACPHFGHDSVCVRASVVSLKNSRSSIRSHRLRNRRRILPPKNSRVKFSN
jgi:hypothetical protein